MFLVYLWSNFSSNFSFFRKWIAIFRNIFPIIRNISVADPGLHITNWYVEKTSKTVPVVRSKYKSVRLQRFISWNCQQWRQITIDSLV